MSDSRDARARSFCEYIGFVKRFHTHTDLHRKDVRRNRPDRVTTAAPTFTTCWKVENWHPDARRAPRAITPADPCLQRATHSSPSSARTANGSPVCGANVLDLHRLEAQDALTECFGLPVIAPRRARARRPTPQRRPRRIRPLGRSRATPLRHIHEDHVLLD